MMRKTTLAALAIGVGLIAAPLAAPGQEDTSSDTYRQLELFGDVFERVRASYVEEVTDEQLIDYAISGMLASLDPHSSYLDAKNYQDMQVQTRGEFGGLGIEVTMEDGWVKVVSPIDDTPAFRAGVEAGDLIIQIDGESVQGLTLAQAVEKMRGPVDTDIQLTLSREGEPPFDVTITRDVIRIESVRSRLEGDVGYIRITAFNEKTASGLESAIDKFKEEKGADLKGIVLDLRNNPGGLLDQAIAVSDAFLEKGEIVSTRGRDPEKGQRFNARPGDMVEGLPVVILINGGSASASEIVAGALQDHRRAILLGTQTFGKGSVQTIIPLAGHGAMRLTTSRYYTPSGRSIQGEGILPDITVAPARIEAIETAKMRREADLRGALDRGDQEPDEPADATPDSDAGAGAETEKNGTESNDTETKGTEKKAPAADGAAAKGKGKIKDAASPEDYQLSRALDLLRGIALYRTQTLN
ncbi:MAG: S41 family peptidase [Proteobacteria bacterium]|nr:S41 family peptidase [Pseudomonadota bacterium]